MARSRRRSANLRSSIICTQPPLRVDKGGMQAGRAWRRARVAVAGTPRFSHSVCSRPYPPCSQLDYNQLSGPIPSTIGQITGLTALALALNSLTSYIPSEIGQLTNLKNLSLQGNPLCLPVPAEVDALAQYTYACTQGTCVETGPAGTAYIDLYAPPYLLPL
mmetsp:Transcript_27107/g.62379  ORF Transcript_27107/g.62379 Transcript_27107/m.62379 type:complete len:162 (-) Transcript_27107:279-764(-)